jgi:hypothetical protein
MNDTNVAFRSFPSYSIYFYSVCFCIHEGAEFESALCVYSLDLTSCRNVALPA